MIIYEYDRMICILVGICPPSPELWKEITERVTSVGTHHTVRWISHSLVHDEGKPTQLFTATSDAPVDVVVAATAEALGAQYSCELWASAPAILPLKPSEGYANRIIHKPDQTYHSWEDWAPRTLKKWGMLLQKSIIGRKEIQELRGYIDEEIDNTENNLKLHRPEIVIGKDTFRFREIASRGNGRFDLLLQSSSARGFVENVIIERVSSLLEIVLGSTNEVDFDMSVVYSKPGAPHQGWHCDGDHQRGGKDAGWDVEGWETQLANAYAFCLFIPLIDLNDETGYTQFWPASHRNRDLMGFGPVAEITEATWDGKCAAGDAIWYDYRLFHRGIANTSTVLRPVVQVLFKKKWYVEKANYGEEGIADVKS
jgi:ectoine hydroxylase-related dioxygenase (phytanoyl-CoA dioxygenase family)